MSVEDYFSGLIEGDVRFGFLDSRAKSKRKFNPEVVLNTGSGSMLRTLREELKRCDSFSFSVAFVSPRAIALLKQEFVDFAGKGTIVTSDYLGFNSPEAFSEIHALTNLGIDSRLHSQTAFHPKGYIFEYEDTVTAILGSSNLTESALVKNHEWNLKVSAARGSDLADQLLELAADQRRNSAPLSQQWIDAYALNYVARMHRPSMPSRLVDPILLGRDSVPLEAHVPLNRNGQEPSTHELEQDRVEPGTVRASGSNWPAPEQHDAIPGRFDGDSPENDRPTRITPNLMQQEALHAIATMRNDGDRKAIVISATGTGKTILSALDVRAVNPKRMLFIVHREQILDKAIAEFKRVLGAPASEFGKLTGGSKSRHTRYVFATVQTLSRPDVLARLEPDAFDYVLIDEVHRAGAPSYERVLGHFEPAFLLGMTATPERPDGFNVFELFDFNVPYEIRLSKALESGMLAPFHYYGVADVEFDDGTTTNVETDLGELASRVRVNHILSALDTYTQAGVEPRGLIFCSRKLEAHALSRALNGSTLRGRLLRTVALTGDDSIDERERVVSRLEAGELDYVLTVDVFNEGVDIPSINQVVMLRQTQSSIVFVQQLGRGLRKHDGKEYLVVIDFIGNYANNYLIPVALFGDESLNKESLRKSLIDAEEVGVLPGLSSVRFDRVAQARVLSSIAVNKLDSLAHLKSAIEMLRNRLGTLPSLSDFLRFESVDPLILATKVGSYPALISKLFKVDHGLSEAQLRALSLLSNEVLSAKRPLELKLLRELINVGESSSQQLEAKLGLGGANAPAAAVMSAARSFQMDFYTKQEQKRYGDGVIVASGEGFALAPEFARWMRENRAFATAVEDLLDTGLTLVDQRYDSHRPFTPGRQYSRKDACRLLGWESNMASIVYGYKVDAATMTCPIFVTHDKSEDVSASTAYEDALLDRSTMRWFTKSKRTLRGAQEAMIAENKVAIHVFAKKDDAEGSGHFYLGEAVSRDAEQTQMLDDSGKLVSVVRMDLHFTEPIEQGVYDYFHPVVSVAV
ncbi:DEAD/DEAH box helicase [Demequina aurantiaca]|uniref:DEAD/DEAH box helicase n=1 Tax=Demequina aurantiaca TaxID=676200 RepID=UPI003D329E34